jgi:hypothetical protein
MTRSAIAARSLPGAAAGRRWVGSLSPAPRRYDVLVGKRGNARQSRRRLPHAVQQRSGSTGGSSAGDSPTPVVIVAAAVISNSRRAVARRAARKRKRGRSSFGETVGEKGSGWGKRVGSFCLNKTRDPDPFSTQHA